MSKSKYITKLRKSILSNANVLSFVISLLPALYSSFVLPMIINAIINITDSSMKPRSYIIGSVLLVLTFFVIIFLFAVLTTLIGSSNKKKLSSCFISLLILFSMGVVAAVLISLLFGAFSVLILIIFRALLDISQIENMIFVLATVIAIITMPIAVNILNVFMFTEEKVLGSIKKGIKTVRKRYKKNFLVIFILCIIGIFISLIFNYLPDILIFHIAKALVLTGAGTMGMVILIRK